MNELQQTLPPETMQRSFHHVCAIAKDAGVNLRQEIIDRLTTTSERTFRILDAGCGTGRSISGALEYSRATAANRGIKKHIIATGVDLNPLPNLMPEYDIEYDFDDTTGKGEFTQTALPRDIELITDDITTLTTINTESVDIGFSIAALNYVPDTLTAFQNGWRVLKPNGMMFWAIPSNLICKPHFSEILANTPNAKKIFSRNKFPKDDEEFAYIVCQKIPTIQQLTFPYQLIGDATPIVRKQTPVTKFTTCGIYEKIAQ